MTRRTGESGPVAARARSAAAAMVAAVLAALAPAACSRGERSETGAQFVPSLSDVVIARVEGEKVQLGLFEAYLRDNLNIADNPPGDGQKTGGVEAAQANAMTDEVKSRLLDRFLLEQALFQKAHAAGIAPSEEQLDQFSRAVGLGPLATIHEGAPFTEREYLRKYLQNCWVVKRYLDSVVLSGIEASEAEAEDYYRTHASRFSSPDRYRLRSIRVETLPEAQALLKQIGKDGATFQSVAANMTEKLEGEGEQGKSLGLWSADELPEPFAVALAPLGQNQVTGAVQDPEGGFNIFYVEEKIEGGTTAFAEVQKRLIELVTRDKRNQALKAFLDQLRRDAKVEIQEGNLGFHYVAKASATPAPAAESSTPPAADASPAGAPAASPSAATPPAPSSPGGAS